LKNNDAKAKEIAQNGRSLYKDLYNMPKMVSDAVAIYTQIASLMRYTPEEPDKKHLFSKWLDRLLRW